MCWMLGDLEELSYVMTSHMYLSKPGFTSLFCNYFSFILEYLSAYYSSSGPLALMISFGGWLFQMRWTSIFIIQIGSAGPEKAKDVNFHLFCGKELLLLLIVFNTNAVLLKLSSLGARFFIAAPNLFSAGIFFKTNFTQVLG